MAELQITPLSEAIRLALRQDIPTLGTASRLAILVEGGVMRVEEGFQYIAIPPNPGRLGQTAIKRRWGWAWVCQHCNREAGVDNHKPAKCPHCGYPKRYLRGEEVAIFYPREFTGGGYYDGGIELTGLWADFARWGELVARRIEWAVMRHWLRGYSARDAAGLAGTNRETARQVINAFHEAWYGA